MEKTNTMSAICVKRIALLEAAWRDAHPQGSFNTRDLYSEKIALPAFRKIAQLQLERPVTAAEMLTILAETIVADGIESPDSGVNTLGHILKVGYGPILEDTE